MPQEENRNIEQVGDDQLDSLLTHADWLLPSHDSTQRLSRQWMQLRRQSYLSNWRPALVIAASLGIVLVGIWNFTGSAPHPRDTIAFQPLTVSTVQAKPAAMDRPATNIELAMLRVVSDQMRASHSAAIVAPPGVPLVPAITGWSVASPIHAVVPASPSVDAAALANRAIGVKDAQQRDTLLDDLVGLGPKHSATACLDLLSRPEAAAPVIAALVRHPQGWSDVLFSALNDPHISVRSSAARALARIDGPATTARLISMANADRNRREAITALVQIHSADARQFVEAAKQSFELGAIVRSAIAENLNIAQSTTGDLR